jgi:hypothetical protein
MIEIEQQNYEKITTQNPEVLLPNDLEIEIDNQNDSNKARFWLIVP